MILVAFVPSSDLKTIMSPTLRLSNAESSLALSIFLIMTTSRTLRFESIRSLETTYKDDPPSLNVC